MSIAESLYFLGILKNISFDWNDMIASIKVYSSLSNNSNFRTINGSDLELSPIPIFPNCKTIDIQDYFQNFSAPTQIFLSLKRIENLGVDLYILDRNVASRRPFKSELLAYTGPTLTNPHLMQIVKDEKHILRITQTKDAAEDESNGCQDYPNGNYQTYSDCDADFVHKQILVEVEGVMPFWATDNLNKVTAFR